MRKFVGWTGFLAALWAVGCFFPAQAKELLSSQVEVEVSNQPNPIWSKEKLVDGKDSPTSGWLCNRRDGCWLELTLPESAAVDELWLRQAAFPQTGPHRYARAKEVQVSFDGAKPLRFELEDREESFQKLTFSPAQGQKVRVEAVSFYEEATVKELSGFQEVKVFRSEQAVAAGGGKNKSSGGGSLEEKEKHILELLNELMAELEMYFMEN